MLREAIEIIPRCMRRRGAVVVATIFARALLNFVGLAVIVPVLVLILDGGSHLSPETPLGRAYTLSGFDSYASFTIAVCAAVIAVVAIKSLANILLCRIESRYIYDLYRRLSRSLFIRYHDRGLQFVKSSNSAVLARNINFVCLAAVTGILKPLSTIVCELMLVVLMFAAVALYSPAAALLVAAVFLPSAWLYLSAVRNRLEHYGVEENDAQRRKARIVAEALRGYADMEVGNAFPQTMRRFENETKMISEMRVRNTTLSMLPQAFTELGIVFGMSAMIVADIGMDSDRLRLLFGILAVAALRLMPSIRNILNSWTSIRYNRYTLDILREAGMDDEPAETRTCTERLGLRQKIEVRGVSFRFDGAPADTLHDMSLTIRRGERVGISGASGAGKTTLFNLLLGLYTPGRGEILIDGVPLAPDNRRAWQNTVGYVSQNVFILDTTLAQNIALADEPDKIDRSRLDRALDAADLREFVDSLPDGADTRIGEAGSRISGGQRQRIGIARALYRSCDVLMFDEATSSLDERSENNINDAIERLARDNDGLTIIIISHRRSTLERCRRVITLTPNDRSI